MEWNVWAKKKKILVKKKREKGKERTKEEIEWNEKKKYAHLILEVDCLSFSFFFLGLLSIKHNSNVTLFD